MQCPRCSQEQPDGHAECGHCGVIFARYRPRPASRAAEPPEVPPDLPLARRILDELRERMFQVEPDPGPGFWGRALCSLLLLGGWVHCLIVPMAGEALMNSWLHLIHLPFHEAGHFVFRPFGTFIMILGGTLGQLLVPLIVAGAFLRERNPYGASVGVWWLGHSFMDCAPYINDARARVLMLLSGETGQEDWEGHDWYQLLSRLGWLRQDHAIARLFWLAGAALMLAALAWGGFVLWRQRAAPPLGERMR